MNNGNLILYDTNILIPSRTPCEKSRCKPVNMNLLLSATNSYVNIPDKKHCQKKKPCQKKKLCDESDDECPSENMSLTSSSSYDSFDSFDDSDNELLIHEIKRSRVLFKKNYNTNQY